MTSSRPAVLAQDHAISSGHPLASEAGLAVLEAGGNAVDAGVAAGLVLGVVHSDLVNVAGVAPIILKMADQAPVTLDGLGTWPRAASAEFFAREYGGEIPEGILRTIVPAAPDAWITALRQFGTMRFAEVAEAAIRHASEGFTVYPLFAEIIAGNQDRYRAHPSSADIYLPNGQPPRVGENFRQRDLAATLQYMADQETACCGSRDAGLTAARDAFYTGDIARTICDYHAAHGGFLTREDMAGHRTRFEAPIPVPFAGSDIYCCGAWCQGISLAQCFAMLDEAKLRKLPLNSVEYIHYLTEVYKLIFADRERYVADPDFVDVPVAAMLDAGYLAERAKLIDPDRAFPGLPDAGQLWNTGPVPCACSPAAGESNASDLDTSHVSVVDRHGNMFVATPSDPSADTVVIPGTGLSVSSRGSQSRGVPGHVNAVAPGKRPRLTPNPALALKDGKPHFTIGTPGGDIQVQAMTQVVINMLLHDADVQSAIEMPRFASYSFPSSFAPNECFPGLLKLESRIDPDIGAALSELGHKIEWWEDWSWKAGGVCVVSVTENGPNRRLHAGADPRRANTAMGQ